MRATSLAGAGGGVESLEAVERAIDETHGRWTFQDTEIGGRGIQNRMGQSGRVQRVTECGGFACELVPCRQNFGGNLRSTRPLRCVPVLPRIRWTGRLAEMPNRRGPELAEIGRVPCDNEANAAGFAG